MTDDLNQHGQPFADAPVIGLLAEIIAAARQQKALFDAYIEAGFTEPQALYLTGAAVGGAR